MTSDRAADLNRIWTEVVANSALLETCAGHAFTVDVSPGTFIGKRWQCIHCRGMVNTTDKHWYETGAKHARAARG